MKRLSSSDSLGALISICPNTTVDLDESNNQMYSREFETMLDEENCCVEESGQFSEKKRRLNVDQVKALEKNFEVENKLEPERKVKLAQELGLQPRQVAVWFQNRRARWKTKQLERDYGVLKSNYDSLKLKYETLLRDNQSLLNEIREVKSKLTTDGKSANRICIKEEPSVSDAGDEKNNVESNGNEAAIMEEIKLEKETIGGGSDSSDSSAIVNEDHMNINNTTIAAKFSDGSTSAMNINSSQFSDNGNNVLGDHAKKAYHHQTQFVKIEEHNFFGEELCSNLFCDDQAPTLHWYEWN